MDPQNTQQQPTTQQLSSSFASGIIIGGLVLFFIGSFIGFYLGRREEITLTSQATPTKADIPSIKPTTIEDETADWKTYRSKKYSFLIKYPNNWETYVYGFEPKDEPKEGLPRFFRPLNKTTQITLEISENKNNLFELQANSIKNYLWSNKVTKESKIAGTSGIRVTGSDQGFKQSAIIFANQDFIYKFQSSGEDALSILDQILSTFKFLDNKQASTSSLADENGVDLQHIKYALPSGWTGEIQTYEGIKGLNISYPTGGYINVFAYDFPANIGRRDFFCQINKVCTSSSTFKEVKLGNISGYLGEKLDASGSGPEYFGAKGNRFYIIYTQCPVYPPNNECDQHRQEILDSLEF